MKKFLFTLAALMMAGSLCAEEYLYIEDFEVKQDQLNKTITVPVKGHFEDAVSAAQCNLFLPEGLTLTRIQKGSSITELTYFDEYGDEYEAENTIFTPAVATTNFAFATVDKGYYEVNGEWVEYGAVKFLPGEYDEMAKLTIRVAADFKGGEINVETMPSCGNDTREDVTPCVKNQDNFKVCIVTVEGVEPQLEDLTGEIVIGEPTEDGVVAISYTGDEDVTITVTVNGEEVALTDGAIQLAEGVNTITVTVEAEGYNPMTAEAEVEWYAPVVPEVTEAPVITYETTDDAVIVTAAGNGEVLLYCNGQAVENPYTIARGEQDATYTFTATAQEAGKEISTITTLVVTVPAVEVGPGPEDPHMTGYWLVMLDQNNQPVWYALNEGEGGMTTSVALEYGVYGRYDHDAGYRGNVPFYFVVNGVMYGADYDMREAEMGKMENTLNNPLYAGDDIYYCVPVGYYYTLGIYTNPEGQMYVYCAQAGYVGVDELNANKAVAGVRYFNMAGQEMQEANGMTIVVTTYTDGTTSAVKVMK